MKNNYLFETERCWLRPFHPEDAEGVYNLNLHPDILVHTTDPPFESIAAAEAFIKAYKAYEEFGFGRWAVILKSTNKFAGWCGLKFILSENEVDIGYRFLPEEWGKGFAVETAAVCIRAGIHEFGLRRIVARIHKDNFRSVRVAEKLGMQYEKDLMYDGIPWLNYVHIKEPESDYTSRPLFPCPVI
jgi:RimJ/RimL family protein N-acetyltransferase